MFHRNNKQPLMNSRFVTSSKFDSGPTVRSIENTLQQEYRARNICLIDLNSIPIME